LDKNAETQRRGVEEKIKETREKTEKLRKESSQKIIGFIPLLSPKGYRH